MEYVPASQNRLQGCFLLCTKYCNFQGLCCQFKRHSLSPSALEMSSNSETEESHAIIQDHENNPDEMLSSITEDRMRRKLQFFFMNPIEKWHARRRFPYKFVVQLIKIFLVTMQLCLFAYSRYNHVNYTWDNTITFSHLFLKGWDPSREIDSYPPAAGPMAVYQKDEFYDTLNFAFEGYANLNQAIGPYSYVNEDNSMAPMRLCLYQYKKGIIYGFNESFVFDSEIIETCLNMTKEIPGELFDSRQYLEGHFNFSALVRAELTFSIKTVSFKSAGPITPPSCYQFDIKIEFLNEDHDGQMVLSLVAEPLRLMCKGDTHYFTNNQLDAAIRSLLNYLVIIICVISFVLCSRAIWRAQQLKRITNQFFILNYNKPLNSDDSGKFLNMWYIMIIVNDVLIIIGSSVKERIERREFTTDQWNACSVFLGTGNMLVWFGVLRYLGFFKTYNVVILTLQKAAPTVARFLLCALLIYAGYAFCGWLILGPFHMKFRSLSSTSECLYSLINGDDMFATFSIMSNKSELLWWYSRLYLYSFISLYIYVILNLFITVINDAYETIKLYYKQGFPKTPLEEFVGKQRFDEVANGLFRSNSDSSLGGLMKDLCCCKKIKKSYSTLAPSNSTLTETPPPGSMPV
ncbi:mucolipin-3-like [Onthophagus taurus]|uniref:mucolipin-3-like n=1 Tax=Onthophagus taurus TaxID=166361 RepID=UPI0039BDACD2